MCGYAYKVNIDRSYQQIGTDHNQVIESDRLTVGELRKIVGDNAFTIDPRMNGGYVISWTSYRLETFEERKARIDKAEAYNAEVERRRIEK